MVYHLVEIRSLMPSEPCGTGWSCCWSLTHGQRMPGGKVKVMSIWLEVDVGDLPRSLGAKGALPQFTVQHRLESPKLGATCYPIPSLTPPPIRSWLDPDFRWVPRHAWVVADAT